MKYAEVASVRRKARWAWLAIALFALFPIIGIGACTADDLRLRLGHFQPIDKWWAVSHFTCVVARTSFLVVCVALLGWIFGNMLRGAFRLPPRTTRSKRFRQVQIGFAVVVGLVVCVWSIDESNVRHMPWSPVGALVLGLLFALPLWYRMPSFFRGAYQALVERARLGGALLSLAALPGEGRVRTAGVIRGTTSALDAEPGAIVYERDLSGGEERVASVLIEDQGERVWVDAAAGQVLVEADAETEPPEADPQVVDVRELARLRVGDRVEVIGEVSGGGERGYRQALARIAAHDGRLLLLAAPSRLRGRLLLAAIVESLAGLALLVAPVGFIIWWWFAGGHAYLF